MDKALTMQTEHSLDSQNPHDKIQAGVAATSDLGAQDVETEVSSWQAD